jgi:hypothetical protein
MHPNIRHFYRQKTVPPGPPRLTEKERKSYPTPTALVSLFSTCNGCLPSLVYGHMNAARFCAAPSPPAISAARNQTPPEMPRKGLVGRRCSKSGWDFLAGNNKTLSICFFID